MIEIKGKYNTASIYTDSIEDEAYKQVLSQHPNVQEKRNAEAADLPREGIVGFK